MVFRRLSALVLGLSLLAGGAAGAQTPSPPVAGAQSPSDFLAANAKAAGVQVLPSGLQYKVVSTGPAGPSPKIGDVIKVSYEGTLLSGQVFDSTATHGRPAIMQLYDLVPGWMEALPLMHVGDEWILYVPPALGYGDQATGPIPAGSVLVFKLKLLGMLSAD